MPVSNAPFLDTVVSSGTPNTPASVQALLAALPAARQPSALSNPSGILRCAYLQIQADPASAGTPNFFIGSNASMTSSAQTGVALTKGQSWTPPTMGTNVYRLDQIFLSSDTASMRWYISFVAR
jgi:hypothetical protein